TPRGAPHPYLVGAERPSHRTDLGQLRLQLPTFHRTEPDRDLGYLSVDPREPDLADPRTSRGGQDALVGGARCEGGGERLRSDLLSTRGVAGGTAPGRRPHARAPAAEEVPVDLASHHRRSRVRTDDAA